MHAFTVGLLHFLVLSIELSVVLAQGPYYPNHWYGANMVISYKSYVDFINIPRGIFVVAKSLNLIRFLWWMKVLWSHTFVDSIPSRGMNFGENNITFILLLRAIEILLSVQTIITFNITVHLQKMYGPRKLLPRPMYEFSLHLQHSLRLSLSCDQVVLQQSLEQSLLFIFHWLM